MGMQLQNRKIILGITGGIAAYKSCELARLLIKQGADVHVVMTDAASKLVSKTTLEALTGHEVASEIFSDAKNIDHISLGADADLILTAPCTANTIAKFAAGMADNMLTAVTLAAPCIKIIAPAMNSRMYLNQATQDNIALLRKRGFYVIEPATGELACGEIATGRMREPSEICAIVCAILNNQILTFSEETLLPPPNAPLELTQTKLLPKAVGAGKKVLITAGPTEEPIDPVRVLTNRSSGKMGYALAAAAAARGAEVTLVSGPVSLKVPDGVKAIKVKTAQDMFLAVTEHAKDNDIVIGCAAVSDYRVEKVSDQKIKKQDGIDELMLKLVKNPDIIATVGHMEHKRPFTVGFAAETNNIEHYAKDKIVKKNLDLIVLNDVSKQDIGFNSDFNAVTVFDKEGKVAAFPKMTKEVLSGVLMDLIFEMNKKA